MKSVFDIAFNDLTKEDLAVCLPLSNFGMPDALFTQRYKMMADERKKAAKDAKSSALGAS
jgi:hypothetical protein